jgi:hypothetical protein
VQRPLHLARRALALVRAVVQVGHPGAVAVAFGAADAAPLREPKAALPGAALGGPVITWGDNSVSKCGQCGSHSQAKGPGTTSV